MEQISPEETKITLEEYIAKNNINNIDFMGYSRDEIVKYKVFGIGYPITKKETMLCYSLEFQAEENSGKQIHGVRKSVQRDGQHGAEVAQSEEIDGGLEEGSE